MFFFASFRPCEAGEITVDGVMCEVCPYRSFTLTGTELKCRECIEDVECHGRDLVHVLPGFWRNSNFSLLVS